jgi:hypothetical protein
VAHIEIQLTQGKVAVIDSKFSRLAALKWYAAFNKRNGRWTAQREVKRPDGSRYTLVLSRAVMAMELGRELEPTEHVDHRNHDTFDNRLDNLRVSTPAENSHNKRKSKSNTSGYKGVSLHRKTGRWLAQIVHNRKWVYLGLHPTRESAAKAYDNAAKTLHKEYAMTNGDIQCR